MERKDRCGYRGPSCHVKDRDEDAFLLFVRSFVRMCARMLADLAYPDFERYDEVDATL